MFIPKKSSKRSTGDVESRFDNPFDINSPKVLKNDLHSSEKKDSLTLFKKTFTQKGVAGHVKGAFDKLLKRIWHIFDQLSREMRN